MKFLTGVIKVIANTKYSILVGSPIVLNTGVRFHIICQRKQQVMVLAGTQTGETCVVFPIRLKAQPKTDAIKVQLNIEIVRLRFE